MMRTKGLWTKYGDAIIRGLESATGLQFINGATIIIGYDQSKSSWSGRSGNHGRKAISILLPEERCVASDDLILWLPIHELGHRLLDQHNIRTEATNNEDNWDEQEHKLLFSILIEAMFIAFGREHANKIIEDYPECGYTDSSFGHTRAWRWAISKTPNERKHSWNRYLTRYKSG